MALAVINIGSNKGDRERLICRATELISNHFGICCISTPVESKPWGYESENTFLNLGISFHTELDPLSLLDVLQRIEKEICRDPHRDSKGNYIDREIDIDIMAFGNMRYESERLTIPHRHLLQRSFFLTPLLQLVPDWQYPEK